MSDKEQGPRQLWINPKQAFLYAKSEELRDPYDTERYIRADLAQPAGELTVEQALKELREMFPDIEGAKYDLLQRHLVISLPEQWLKYFSGASISDCMSQVREWTKSQTVEQKGS